MTFSPFLAPNRDDAHAQGRPKSGTTFYTVPGVAIIVGDSTTLAAGTDYYAPIYVHTPIVVDQLAFQVDALAAGNARVGLYAADRDWQPRGGPLADSGDISVNSTGVKTYTPGTPIYLPRGRYLTVMNSSVTPTIGCPLGFPPEASPQSTTALPSMMRLWRVTRAYAAFPTPGTAWTTTTASASLPMHQLVLLRVLAP